LINKGNHFLSRISFGSYIIWKQSRLWPMAPQSSQVCLSGMVTLIFSNYLDKDSIFAKIKSNASTSYMPFFWEVPLYHLPIGSNSSPFLLWLHMPHLHIWSYVLLCVLHSWSSLLCRSTHYRMYPLLTIFLTHDV